MAETAREGVVAGSVAPVAGGGRSLKQAVITALILVGLIAVAAVLGKPAFFVLVCAVVLIANYELLDALVRTGHAPSVPFGLACTMGMLVVAFADRPNLIAVVLAVTMFGSFLLSLRPGRGASPASDVAWVFLSVGWIGGGGAGATFIMGLEPHGLSLLIAFVLVTALDDIGAYFAGTRFGRHKMAPSISPAKSWEGFAGGLLVTIVSGGVAGALVPVLGVAYGLGLGALCGLLAPIGDLMESIAKREIGIKDSGSLLPGHGGLLDRLDAIVFCAPAAFLYLRFVVF